MFYILQVVIFFMRTFFIFKIKNEYSNLTKNDPYLLFRLFSYIYHLDKKSINNGVLLFYNVVDNLNYKNLDKQIFLNHEQDYFYTKFYNFHQIHNIYINEDSNLEVHKHYLILKSSIIKPGFFHDLKSISNLFICDFENIDYFWLENLLG